MLANGRSLPVDICGAALNLRQMLGQLEMRGRVFHGWTMVLCYAQIGFEMVVSERVEYLRWEGACAGEWVGVHEGSLTACS